MRTDDIAGEGEKLLAGQPLEKADAGPSGGKAAERAGQRVLSVLSILYPRPLLLEGTTFNPGRPIHGWGGAASGTTGCRAALICLICATARALTCCSDRIIRSTCSWSRWTIYGWPVPSSASNLPNCLWALSFSSLRKRTNVVHRRTAELARFGARLNFRPPASLLLRNCLLFFDIRVGYLAFVHFLASWSTTSCTTAASACSTAVACISGTVVLHRLAAVASDDDPGHLGHLCRFFLLTARLAACSTSPCACRTDRPTNANSLIRPSSTYSRACRA